MTGLTLGEMSDANYLPENPYAAPQVVAAELVPAIDPAALGPDELPCHRCGQGVSQDAATCPRCGARPCYDGLQLIVTAALVMMLLLTMDLWMNVPRKTMDGTPYFLIMGLAIAVIMPTVKLLFTKLKRGRW